MIKNIVFDMGNVLLRYDPEVPLALFCRTPEEKEAVRTELFGGQEWVAGDLGTSAYRKRCTRRCVAAFMNGASV